MFTSPSATQTLPKNVVHHRQASSLCTTLSECSFHSAEDVLDALDLDYYGAGVHGWRGRERSRLHTRSRSMDSFPPFGGPGPPLGQGLPENGASSVHAAEGTTLKSRPPVPPLDLQHTNSSKFKATISVEFCEEGPGGFRTSQNHLFVASQPMHFYTAGASQRDMAQASSFQSGKRSSKGVSPFQAVSNELFIAGQDAQPQNVGSGEWGKPFQSGKHVAVRPPVRRTPSRFARFACMCATPADGQGVYPDDGIQGPRKDSVPDRGESTPMSTSSSGRLKSIWASFRRRNSGSSSRSSSAVYDGGDECPEGGSLVHYAPRAKQPPAEGKSTMVSKGGFTDLKTKSLCPSIPGTDTRQFTADGPNAAWVDEQFFDCKDTWDVVLAPWESAVDTDRLTENQPPVANNRTIAPRGNGPQRPHRQKASVEDLNPIYPPLSARGGTDDVNRNWVGSLSARKVRLPGLADVPRQDEMGEGLKTLEELMERCSGVWERVPEESDDPSPLCDVMELPWVFKRALGMATQTEVTVYDDRVFVKPKLFGIPIPTAATPWSREGVMVPRRDKRKGMSRISLVRTTFGFRQYNCWADPYAGMSIVEIGISDDGKLTMSTFVKRRTGPSCKIRTCMVKVQ